MTFDANCRRCNAPMRWCVTTNGRRMPLDYEPDESGNVICEYRDGVLIGRVLTKGDPRPPGIAFMPHFATCAKRPRRPKKPPKVKPEPAPSLFDQPKEPTQ